MQAKSAEHLQAIFRAVLELPEGTDVTHLSQLDTPAWDSLAHVSLVAAIESEFGMSLDISDQLQMTSYATTAAILGIGHP
jgi:acyl carrier protein